MPKTTEESLEADNTSNPDDVSLILDDDSSSSTEPFTGESLSFLQQRLGINSILSAINDFSNLVKRSQDVKGDEPSPD